MFCSNYVLVLDKQVICAENYDLTNIITPVKTKHFISELRKANYPKQDIEFLEKGFTEGFDIGYKGPRNRQSISSNIPLKQGTKVQLWNKVMKEVQVGRVAGPYDKVPFDNFIQSPIGLVPKKGSDKLRLIFHLSYQFGDRKQDVSLNASTPRDLCSVSYNDIDHAVRICLKLKGKGSPSGINNSRPIYMGKCDARSALRLVPLSRESWPWLIMKAVNPLTGKVQYFVDKCLPFGASISCALFQKVSDALKFLIEFRLKVPDQVSNYLDDFLFIALTIWACNLIIKGFLDMCQELGVPISKEKTEWGTVRIVFLGLLLDGEFFLIALPEEKRTRAVALLQHFLTKRKATVKELQGLCGYLNFLNRAIYPGRTFTCRMYAKFEGCVSKSRTTSQMESSNQAFHLKPYHHVCLDSEFKADCRIWLEFLTQTQISKVINRPMIDIMDETKAKEIGFYSDSSAAPDLGFGAIFGKFWTFGQWNPQFIKQQKPSIEYLELFALCAGILTWHEHRKLNNTKIIVHCDNQAVVGMINKLSSSCKNCMVLLRLLVLDGLIHNRRLSARYIKSRDNVLSDVLSRLKIEKFKSLAPNMQAYLDKIPSHIWPLDKIWLY